MSLREFLFGSLEPVRLSRDPSLCDEKIVGDLLQKGVDSYYSGRGVNVAMFEMFSDKATSREVKEARRLFRESVGIGVEPTNKDWGC